MTLTIIIITLLICILFYLILNDKLNKIKKEYIKTDLISEIKEIVAYFNQEADRNINLLEEKIKEIDNKIKKLEKLKKNLEESYLFEINKNQKNKKNNISNENIYESNQIESIDNFEEYSEKVRKKDVRYSIDNDKKSKKHKSIEEKIEKEENEYSWQKKAYGMFSNGFSYEEISKKLNRNVGEIQFAISYIDMKNRIDSNKIENN